MTRAALARPGSPASATVVRGEERPSLSAWRESTSLYEAYTYAYPHKTAYRMFAQPRALEEVWGDEDKSALFAYLHVPFCEMRCGFCNLFTQVRPGGSLEERYLETLAHQVAALEQALGPDRSFARAALGGGTPTFLEPAALERALDLVERLAGDLRRIPLSVETSPGTSEAEKLAMLVERGADRISIGIQSFYDDELKALGRPTRALDGARALERIRASGVQSLNLDLIYGAAGQTPARFLSSIEQALAFTPEEVFLYPLYVRPLTGLGRQARSWDDERLEMYRAGRERLLEAGYRQLSMRLFRRPPDDDNAPSPPRYSCQEDGMVGLGCGARSYTRSLHYSEEWAVQKDSVKEIIGSWVAREPSSFEGVRYGMVLDDEVQRTRFIVQAVGHADGLDLGRYRARFGTAALDDRPALGELLSAEMLVREGEVLLPTARGFEESDRVGPWLYDDTVRGRMEGFDLR